MSKKTAVNLKGPLFISKDMLEEIASHIKNNFWNHPEKIGGDCEVDVDIVSNRSIRSINRSYLGRDRSTDVIAFSFSEGVKTPACGKNMLGQIIISGEKAKENADAYSHSHKRELTLLFIHGMLHLCGWEEGRKIKAEEQKILNRFYPLK